MSTKRGIARPVPRRRRLAGWVLAVSWIGCSTSREPPPGGSSAASGASATSTASSSLEEPEAFGPHWDKARRTMDPLDIAEVGQREGGPGLVRGLADPTYAEVARRALPSVPDATVAIEPLARAFVAGGADAEASAEALVAVLEAPYGYGERLDPEGEERAAEALIAHARDEKAAGRSRARAVTILRRMAARGMVSEARIPTEKDAPAPAQR